MGYLKKLSKYQYCRGGRFYFADVNQPSEPAQQPSEPAQQPSEPDQQPSEYTQPSAETPQEGKDSLLNSIKFALDMKKALFEVISRLWSKSLISWQCAQYCLSFQSLLDMHQTDARSGYYGGGHCGKKRVKKMYKLTLMHTNLERLENHLGADKKIGPSTVWRVDASFTYHRLLFEDAMNRWGNLVTDTQLCNDLCTHLYNENNNTHRVGSRDYCFNHSPSRAEFTQRTEARHAATGSAPGSNKYF